VDRDDALVFVTFCRAGQRLLGKVPRWSACLSLQRLGVLFQQGLNPADGQKDHFRKATQPDSLSLLRQIHPLFLVARPG